jgi:putative hydrolase of the HAD superfamily
MDQVRNIIFDFGKVIVNIDWERVKKELSAKGVKNIDELHNYLMEENYYLDLETGEISAHTFREAIRMFIGDHTPDYEIDAAWNSMILDIPEPRVRLLEKLKDKYRTFLLSNTNEIHFNHYNAYFARTFGYDNLADIFEEAYFSHELRLRKPNPEIYKVVLEKHGLTAGETLFFDDMIQNIKSAREMGIMGYHIKEGEDFVGLFDYTCET